MKAIIQIIILLGIVPQLYGQGAVFMSNIPDGRGKILLNGVPVGAGEATVQLANSDGELIGKPVDVLGGGSFTSGTQFLFGYTGTVTLKLAVIYKVMPENIIYSNPFSVTLGGSGIPPSPAAFLPPFDSINFKFDAEPLDSDRPWPIRKDTWVNINHQEPATFYRAENLKILKIEDDSIAISYTGTLEVSVHSEGPWKLVE